MNPYESSSRANLSSGQRDTKRTQPLAPFIIATLFLAGGILGLLSIAIPWLRGATIPRFGWIGLILCLNPLLFLVVWIRKPTRPSLMGSASLSCTIGVINAVELIFKGTVPIVANEFTDRLHSSWLWSVFSFLAIGMYLFWIAITMPADPVATIPDEPVGTGQNRLQNG